MSDFERRLRAAMESAVVNEQPPGNLVELVRRRHRRHTTRVAVAGIAIVAAGLAAIPPTTAALLRPAGHGSSSAPDHPAKATTPAPSRPGGSSAGLYYGCGSQTYGALGPHWRSGTIHAGPAWFINRGTAPHFRFYNSNGTLKAVPIIVMLRGSTTVRVQAAGTGKRYFRFLPGFSGTDQYTLHDGKAEATFGGCSDRQSMYGDGWTEFYVGIIVAGPRCVTLDVTTPADHRAIPARLSFGSCGTSK